LHIVESENPYESTRVVDVEYLKRSIHLLPGDLELFPEDNRLGIRASAEITVGLDARDDSHPMSYPILGDEVNDVIGGAALNAVLRALIPALGNGEKRPNLARIHVEGEIAYATDGYKLATAAMPGISRIDIPLDIAAALEIITADTDAPVAMAMRDGTFFASLDGWKLRGEIGGEYPDVSRYLTHFVIGAQATVLTADLIAAAKMCLAVSKTIDIDTAPELGAIFLRSKNAYGERGQVLIETTSDVGTPQGTTIAIDLLLHALDRYAKYTTIEFFVNQKEIRISGGQKSTILAPYIS